MKMPEAFNRVSYHIALAAETLIRPCVVEITTCVLGEGSKKET
jgi:hypothetical protein